MSEDTYWIADSQGHRRAERTTAPPDGTQMETFFGTATVINTVQFFPDDAWYCDGCNEDIVTELFGDHWPVPVVEGYAFCHRCMERYDYPRPKMLCSCRGCHDTAIRWVLPILKTAVSD